MKSEKCEEIVETRRCRNDHAITVCGKRMCWEHWERHCEVKPNVAP